MSLPRYSEYKDSGVEWLGEVPGHWHLDRLKRSIVSCKNGIWGEEAQEDESDIPCVRVADFNRQRLSVVLDEPTIRNVTEKERVGRVLSKGDLLLEKSGGGESQPVGCVVLYDDARPAVCSNFVARMQMAAGMDSSYWRYVHAAAYAIRLTTGSINQTSGIQNLDQDRYFNERVAFPPHDEQQTIAAFLDREKGKIDALIAEQRRLVELLAEKRQAVISHAVTKGLNPSAKMKDSGIEWLGEVPEHWAVGTLTRIAERIVVGIAEAATHAYVEVGTPILRATNVRPGKIIGELLYLDSDFADDRGSKLLNAGDLVTVRTGNAGVTAVVPKELDGCQCFTMLITTLISTSVADFYCYWMNGVAARCYFSLEGWGTAQINISVPILKCLPVPIPTLEEQQAIVAFLDAETAKLDTLTAEANRAIELLHEHRSALISAAVTGKIDVRSLSPASLPPLPR